MLSNAQAGWGIRSSVPTLQNLQTENLSLRAGSGDFFSLVSQQNETQNAQMRKQSESQNNMLRECLTGITNVVGENMNGITEQLSNITGLIQSSHNQSKEATHANVSSFLPSTVPSRLLRQVRDMRAFHKTQVTVRQLGIILFM